MSSVVNVVLVTGLDETSVSEVNEWLRGRGFGELARVDGLAGGSKVMECNVYLGAFNNLADQKFADFAASRDWAWPEDFCLYINTESDSYIRWSSIPQRPSGRV